MRSLRYNIAPEQRLNHWRFWIVTSVFLVVSGLLVWFGIQVMNGKPALSRTELDAMQAERIPEGEYASKMEALNREIDLLKKRWNGRVRFANALIERKTYSFVEGMTLLEEILPSPVFLNSLRMDQDRKKRLDMEISAARFADLIDCYKQLARFNLEVNSETRDRNGHYRVSLTLRY